MQQERFDIFISYKRKSLPTANNLYYRLTTRGYSTFFDLEEMGRDNFNVQLLTYIENAKDVFVILEEGSLDACKDDEWEKDWFCQEIAFALEKKRNIIPILIGGYKMPSQEFFPERLKELSLKNAPDFNFSFFEAYLDKLIKKDYLLSNPNILDKTTSVFKFYSNENCQVFKEGKLVCSLEGMSDEPYYLPVPRKGDYRFKVVNVVTNLSMIIDEEIDAMQEKIVEIEWRIKDNKDKTVPQHELKALPLENKHDNKGVQYLDECDSFNVNIPVSINDQSTPMAIFVGPPAVGKTMTIVRLAKYLMQKGYTVSADRSFRPCNDSYYCNLCDYFDYLIANNIQARGNCWNECVMISVGRGNSSVLQCIDVPGDIFNSNDCIPAYFHQIVHTHNPKIWIMLIEPKWKGKEVSESYIKNIYKYRKSFISSSDKVILLINKVDITFHVYEKDRVMMSTLISELQNYYPGLMDSFRNSNKFVSIIRKYICDIIPFQTGMYTLNNMGTSMFTPASDYFPELLWKSLKY
ncbi:TIR domain-containing protein [Prevotella sp. E13-17]|uniref:TIR domain-containing protein n=1 Tax=Prevotella sp. E13-17 TaxID=2913616 RepID=UPI001EDA9736|nr:TIR domain-containing protein [Prevotella sp. E13-17]UKK50053.1 TIR domain-containing protein [Prevotella sp. E13-17]